MQIDEPQPVLLPPPSSRSSPAQGPARPKFRFPTLPSFPRADPNLNFPALPRAPPVMPLPSHRLLTIGTFLSLALHLHLRPSLFFPTPIPSPSSWRLLDSTFTSSFLTLVAENEFLKRYWIVLAPATVALVISLASFGKRFFGEEKFNLRNVSLCTAAACALTLAHDAARQILFASNAEVSLIGYGMFSASVGFFMPVVAALIAPNNNNNNKRANLLTLAPITFGLVFHGYWIAAHFSGILAFASEFENLSRESALVFVSSTMFPLSVILAKESWVATAAAVLLLGVLAVLPAEIKSKIFRFTKVRAKAARRVVGQIFTLVIKVGFLIQDRIVSGIRTIGRYAWAFFLRPLLWALRATARFMYQWAIQPCASLIVRFAKSVAFYHDLFMARSYRFGIFVSTNILMPLGNSIHA